MIAVVGFREPAGQINTVPVHVVEHRDAAWLKEQIDIEHVDEDAVEAMVAVDEGEIELAALGGQAGQHQSGGFRVKLQVGAETKLTERAQRGIVVNRALKRIHDYMVRRADPILRQGLEDVEGRQTPRHPDFQGAGRAVRAGNLQQETSALGRYRNRHDTVGCAVLALDGLGGVDPFDAFADAPHKLIVERPLNRFSHPNASGYSRESMVPAPKVAAAAAAPVNALSRPLRHQERVVIRVLAAPTANSTNKVATAE